MSNIVELKARRARHTAAEAVADRADLRALQDLRALCEQALVAGGLDAGGPTMLDLQVAVHRAVKGSEWKVRFHRGQATGL